MKELPRRPWRQRRQGVLAWLGSVQLRMSTQQPSTHHNGGQRDVLQATVYTAMAASRRGSARRRSGSARQGKHSASDAEVMVEQAVVLRTSSQGETTEQCRAWPLAACSAGPDAPPAKAGQGMARQSLVSSLDIARQPGCYDPRANEWQQVDKAAAPRPCARVPSRWQCGCGRRIGVLGRAGSGGTASSGDGRGQRTVVDGLSTQRKAMRMHMRHDGAQPAWQ